MEHGGDALAPVELFRELCERLADSGVPLFRASGALPTLHPQHFTRGLTWVRGEGASETAREHGLLQTAAYRDSPVFLIHQGAAAIRRRLDRPETVLDFPILHELKALGATDYVVLPLRFTRGRPSFISWATDRPGGFAAGELALLSDLMPLIALRFEIEAGRQMMRDLLATYLGANAAGKVLAGTVQRAQGEVIRAAVWFCDLRGFTAMADRMAPRDLIATLDDFLECMARPVQERGGEVLKFIGDGMLAIFRIEGADSAQACRTALAAAFEARERLHVLNQGRALEGGVPLRAGIALHLGEVVYGNIGAKDRLDFTVIGRAVNEVARIEASCAKLGRSLIASAAFAEGCCGFETCPARLVSLGPHVLRGVREPRELYGLAEDDLYDVPPSGSDG
jgi:adenylate cyclase